MYQYFSFVAFQTFRLINAPNVWKNCYHARNENVLNKVEKYKYIFSSVFKISLKCIEVSSNHLQKD